MATSGGHTFQITGTSVGGKVVTTKLPLPANSKIVTVNVPTSQGGIAGFNKSHLRGRPRAAFLLSVHLGDACVFVFIASHQIHTSSI